MKDPSRLLSQAGSLEAQLLEAVRNAEPPADAHDQVWKRLGVAAGAGAATLAVTTPLAARTALGAGTRALAQTGWLSAVKWIAIVGAVAPAAGLGVHWVLASHTTLAPVPTQDSLPRSLPTREVLAPSTQATPKMVPVDVQPSPSSSGLRRGTNVAASHLDAESALLRHAREQLESGDAKGALDDTAAMASHFPRGELAQEREVVAIQALLALGQRVAAATRTTAFVRAHPSSPYADSLRQALKP
jgi:hypothetical protein